MCPRFWTEWTQWTGMKEGLPGGTLRRVDRGSELEEARLDVARWIGFESTQDRRLPAVGGRRDRGGVRVAARCRWSAWADASGRPSRAGGAWRDRVDDRRTVRA